VGADASGSGSVTGETEIRSARDPSPPVLSAVGFRATPVLADESAKDAEQHQEHTDLRLGPETSTIHKLYFVIKTAQCHNDMQDGRLVCESV